MRILLACSIGLMATTALAQNGSSLTTGMLADEGAYVADADGMSLYMFEADSQGDPDGAGAVSACEGDCLAVWPPLIADADLAGDDSLDPDLLGTFERSDGTEQVTYDGWPLYYYIEDAAPGDIRGHDIESFGDEWYLVSPSGALLDDDDDDDDGDDGGDVGGGDDRGGDGGY